MPSTSRARTRPLPWWARAQEAALVKPPPGWRAYLEGNRVSESPERPECAGRLLYGELVQSPLHHAQLFRTPFTASTKPVAISACQGQTAAVMSALEWLRVAGKENEVCVPAGLRRVHRCVVLQQPKHTHQKNKKSKRKEGLLRAFTPEHNGGAPRKER